MTQITVDARAIAQNGDYVTLELERDGRRVVMTTERTATLEELALLILAQAQPGDVDDAFQRRANIEAHQETGIDPETGEEYQYWVIDSVTLEQLPNEAARDGFGALPGWATWTAAEAAQWIQDNVVDLPSAKIALSAMARAIVYLRDWRRD